MSKRKRIRTLNGSVFAKVNVEVQLVLVCTTRLLRCWYRWWRLWSSIARIAVRPSVRPSVCPSIQTGLV